MQVKRFFSCQEQRNDSASKEQSSGNRMLSVVTGDLRQEPKSVWKSFLGKKHGGNLLLISAFHPPS